MTYTSDGQWYWYECAHCHACTPRGTGGRDVDALAQDVYAIENYVCNHCEIHENKILQLEESINEYMERQDQDTKQIEIHEETIKALREENDMLDNLLNLKDLDI
jgi:hypothetical protein